METSSASSPNEVFELAKRLEIESMVFQAFNVSFGDDVGDTLIMM